MFEPSCAHPHTWRRAGALAATAGHPPAARPAGARHEPGAAAQCCKDHQNVRTTRQGQTVATLAPAVAACPSCQQPRRRCRLSETAFHTHCRAWRAVCGPSPCPSRKVPYAVRKALVEALQRLPNAAHGGCFALPLQRGPKKGSRKGRTRGAGRRGSRVPQQLGRSPRGRCEHRRNSPDPRQRGFNGGCLVAHAVRRLLHPCRLLRMSLATPTSGFIHACICGRAGQAAAA